MNTGTKANPLRDEALEHTAASLARIRSHPFILAATSQTLAMEQAERWIFCAGRESQSFPAILMNMVARSTNARIRDLLAANLADEHGNGNPEEAHFKHYLHLLHALQIPRERFFTYRERSGIRLALALAYNVSMEATEAVPLGYMLVNESMTAITYSAAYTALRRYCPGLNTKTPFFDLHVEVDARHVNELLLAVDELPPSARDRLLFGIDLGERGMAVLLDEALGIFDACDVIPGYDPTLVSTN